jgi:hypothetical protein
VHWISGCRSPLSSSNGLSKPASIALARRRCRRKVINKHEHVQDHLLLPRHGGVRGVGAPETLVAIGLLVMIVATILKDPRVGELLQLAAERQEPNTRIKGIPDRSELLQLRHSLAH